MGRGISLPVAYGRLIGEGQCSTQEATQHSKQEEWIWEYVLKNCQDFSIATRLLEAIPIPDTPFIKKLAILKLLSLDVEAGCYAERDLFALQGLERLARDETRKELEEEEDEEENVGVVDREEGQQGGDEKTRRRWRRREMDSMWSKVGVLVKAELALQHLRDGKEDWEGFTDALDRHWGDVVQDTEEPDFCQGNNIKCDLWSLKANHRLSKFILAENKRETVDELVKRFLALAWEDVGQVLLEKVDEDIVNGRYVPGGEKRPRECEDNSDGGADPKKKRVRKTLLASLDGEEAEMSRPPWSGESERPVTRRLRRRCYESEALQTPAVDKAVNELKSSRYNLRKQVRDPLPEAVEVARSLREDTSTANGSLNQQGQPDQQQQEAQPDEPPQPSGSGNRQEERAQLDANLTSKQQEQQAQALGNAAGKGKMSMMERNHTARTREWNDDDDDIEEDTSPSASRRVNLPSSSTKAPSPLQKIEPKVSLLRRRKIKRWTAREEEALRKGVEIFGKGRWKAILQSNLDVFDNRTEVDLKDKWRNIEKAEGIKRD
ncbi:hypothetical protein SELMODRAFT_403080 [Selaginella moellendorffii]|uniref:Uncharacterized protein n=1 Tax=Selaginella moellendorffii TaxID=88036 RepID=D8QNZ6_SELML|nr:uncharacterized protein LOC9633022 [Selaginella moellendorffii]EFJ38842.1 hypothetical protein SELMODRAFT_403080 [Selaginella moellendorffii]|eukprot:XP_002961303.1 uncharacterized protein LOC9633022 [Selaginella moellendorffii]